ncbi:uncharacterized protein MONOS_2143 [Monocercomonoides exilis]|uniref:uncharacterized protein n=1 Tax=Monocercomonoides exilis TaxID=2049356 RepID=UPI00355A515F|nr:hypothetical protein MONOS_2143 [Monocercomonoides exilis]|eukprot:MONOS_2143.1-p1 / transcript=MONOS_2143.1 / gene=MONOS_2143 / organism=Monocercomonoides_exilis_PA203 / gene_product=unspecified product / transcript_product=unspecified product / location=Mono_scaffold00042:87414-88505(+) / protein_length=175 / sequence_SO=supercontig / SO=protein_coding / is_pseudo=false
MHTVVPTVAKKGEGKATVMQRMFMLLEQTTDSRDREELEWPVISRGGTGAGQPGAGWVPLQAGSTAREWLMSAVSGSLTRACAVSGGQGRVQGGRDGVGQLGVGFSCSIEGDMGMVWAETACVDSSVGEGEERSAVDVVPHCAAAGTDGEDAAEEDVQSMVETKEGQIVLVQFC